MRINEQRYIYIYIYDRSEANLFLFFFYHGRVFVSVDPIHKRVLRSDSFLENFFSRIYTTGSRLDSFIILPIYMIVIIAEL